MTQETIQNTLETGLRDLLEIARNQIAKSNVENLVRRPLPQSWNALECFAHLNAIYDYYLPKIELSIHKAKARRWYRVDEFKSGSYGKSLLRRINPENRKARPRKSPKKFNFQGAQLGPETIKGFIINTERLLRYVQQSKELDLTMPRIPAAHNRWFKLNLGDLYCYLLTHAQRHFLQIQDLIAQAH